MQQSARQRLTVSKLRLRQQGLKLCFSIFDDWWWILIWLIKIRIAIRIVCINHLFTHNCISIKICSHSLSGLQALTLLDKMKALGSFFLKYRIPWIFWTYWMMDLGLLMKTHYTLSCYKTQFFLSHGISKIATIAHSWY